MRSARVLRAFLVFASIGTAMNACSSGSSTSKSADAGSRDGSADARSTTTGSGGATSGTGANTGGSGNAGRGPGGTATSGGATASGGSATSSGGTRANSPDAGVGTDSGANDGAWLAIKGSKIVTPDGKPFHGRGSNLHDTRSCNACTSAAPDPTGLIAWADELIDDWHANFIRFDLESYSDDGGYRVQWKTMIDDPQYYEDIQTVVHHMTSKPGVYVMVSLWIDPTMVAPGGAAHSEWPTAATTPEYEMLAEAFHDDPQVLFGLTNEPHDDASSNPDLALAFKTAIAAIRAVEAKYGTHQHIVVAQGTQGYARDLSYWVAHPLGPNVAYETHPYNPQSDFDSLFVEPSKTIPVIIGEFGPDDGYMTVADAQALMTTAEANDIPYISWNFHQRCPPNLLEDQGATGYDGCGLVGAGTAYTWPATSDWGTPFKAQLAKPW